jgi:hypothetical protein
MKSAYLYKKLSTFKLHCPKAALLLQTKQDDIAIDTKQLHLLAEN